LAGEADLPDDFLGAVSQSSRRRGWMRGLSETAEHGETDEY
jgi:hypothetical protein